MLQIYMIFFSFLSLDEKYHLQNYPPITSDQPQHGQHFVLNHYKSNDHQSNSSQHEKFQVDEPNNNHKNNSSASSFDDIDYDESIQNHDSKDSQLLKKMSSDSENLKYEKNFSNRNHFEDHQSEFNGSMQVNDDYRILNINDRKINEDVNSGGMNYASSEEMIQNAASSDHGEKLGSGSEDEGVKRK